MLELAPPPPLPLFLAAVALPYLSAARSSSAQDRSSAARAGPAVSSVDNRPGGEKC